MEFDRVVQVRLAKPDDTVSFATGYLVAPRLALTAAHALGEVEGPRPGLLTVCRPDAGDHRWPAHVRWYRRDAVGGVDAALVEVEENADWSVPASLADLVARPAQRWGRFIGTGPVQVQARGFPRLQRDADRHTRWDEQLAGRINPGAGMMASRYEVLSDDPLPSVDPGLGPTATGWSGMSGAGLVCGDLLVGVVRSDRRAPNGTRLTATRVCDLLADSRFRAVIREHTGWEPVLEPVEPAGMLAPAARARDLRSPAMLLSADAEAVAFTGRERELADLLAWCERSTESLAVRVLIGPGGQGKTRLARRLADLVRERDWVAGILRPEPADGGSGPGPDLAVLDTALPLLLVVDYAETMPNLVRRLIEHLRTSRHRVRILLLARGDGEWRSEILGTGPETRAILQTAPVTELGPLLVPEHRAAGFTAIAADLAALMSRVKALPAADWAGAAARLASPSDLGDARFGSVLTLQMTVLAALLQNGPAPAAVEPGQPAEAVLLGHEARYWLGTAHSATFRLHALREATLARAVAFATLCGAATRAEAATSLGLTSGLPSGREWDMAEWLHSLYPSSPGQYWGSMQPDRLAEFHAAAQFARPGEETVARVLADGADHQQTRAITVLARAAVAHANAPRPSACTEVLRLLYESLDDAALGIGVLQNALAALPSPSEVLVLLALGLAQNLVSAYEYLPAGESEAYNAGLAGALNSLAIRYSQVGRRAEALTAGEKALDIRRRLAEANPAAHEPDFAVELNNIANRYAAVRRRAEALSASRQAADVYRRLAGLDPDRYEPALATVLNNLSVDCSELGHHAEALDLIKQAVEVDRRLAASDPDVHEPALAMALDNLSLRYAEVGQSGMALDIGEQAVDRYGRLAGANPDAYEADLARALNNLSSRYGSVGRHAEGLTAANQALEIRSRLAAVNPEAHEQELADTYNNISIRYADLRMLTEALAADGRALEIRRRLAAANPAAHEPDLAMSLNNTGLDCQDLGRLGDALVNIQESLEIRRRLAAEDPDDYERNVAQSLNALASIYADLGQPEKAAAAREEALEIQRRRTGGAA